MYWNVLFKILITVLPLPCFYLFDGRNSAVSFNLCSGHETIAFKTNITFNPEVRTDPLHMFLLCTVWANIILGIFSSSSWLLLFELSEYEDEDVYKALQLTPQYILVQSTNLYFLIQLLIFCLADWIFFAEYLMV